MFYFEIERASQDYDFEDQDQFWIVSKEFYDSYHCLDDGCNQSNVPLPPGFSEAMEACFEFDGDTEDGRELLIKAGFIEHKIL